MCRYHSIRANAENIKLNYVSEGRKYTWIDLFPTTDNLSCVRIRTILEGDEYV